MELGIGIVAFVVYIVFVIVWYLGLKRSIAEAMLLGLIVCCAFLQRTVPKKWTSLSMTCTPKWRSTLPA